MTKEQLFIHLATQLASEKLFYGHAVIDEEDEAMMVMMYLYNQDVNEILSSGNEIIDSEVFKKASKIVNRRVQTLKPMAYILGTVNFCGLNFKSDERALVPRSPIAELIHNGFAPWVNIDKVQSVLDLCTGSGCIGISIAHYYQYLKVDISDISQQAISLAHENIALHGLSKQVHTIESDLFKNMTQQYDLIVTNPPYVSHDEYNDLPEEYKKEPKLGLVSTQEGLTIPVTILLEAPRYLNDDGYLFLEVGYTDEALDNVFKGINIEWINFLNGGQGVCVFSKQKLIECQNYFKAFLENKHVI